MPRFAQALPCRESIASARKAAADTLSDPSLNGIYPATASDGHTELNPASARAFFGSISRAFVKSSRAEYSFGTELGLCDAIVNIVCQPLSMYLYDFGSTELLTS